MARAFAKIGFTENVKKIQTQMGSRHGYQSFEQGELENVYMTEFERNFIVERDSFYQATINENGWPYVQHRGGPQGFIKVLDEKTIGYADFSGNRQYLSVGNLLGDDRVSLILMNYPERQRLKIWGRARLVDMSLEPELIGQLELEDYRAPVERGVVIRVEALDWNCPKYITPRFSLDEVEHIVAHRIQKTGHQNRTYKEDNIDDGTGAIPLIITAVRQLTKNIRTYEFQHREGDELPVVEAGTHITLPIRQFDGTPTMRSYSLTHLDKNHRTFQIAVKREEKGEGGSKAIHDTWHVGKKVRIDKPKNYFPLHNDERPAVLIAGGIGITPIMAMAQELKLRGGRFEIHYTGKYESGMAFLHELKSDYHNALHCYYSQEDSSIGLDLRKLMASSDDDSLFYICGPKSLLEDALSTATSLAISRDRIQFESFR